MKALTTDLQIRVINLDRSADRLQSVASDLASADLTWERFKAIEPPPSGYLKHHLYNSKGAKRYNCHDLTRGQLGCFLSHLGVIEELLDSERKHLLVLEDDVSVVDDSARVLSEAMRYLQAANQLDWHCLNLTAVYQKRRRLIADFERWRLYRSYYFPILTSGLVWHRSGAEAFLKYVSNKGIFMPVDQQLRFFLAETGMGLSLDRPIFQLRDCSSTIQQPYDVFERHLVSRLHRNLHNYGYAFVARLRNR